MNYDAHTKEVTRWHIHHTTIHVVYKRHANTHTKHFMEKTQDQIESVQANTCMVGPHTVRDLFWKCVCAHIG